MKKKLIDMLKLFVVMLLGTLIMSPLLMKACDADYEYQQAKYSQWQQDSQLNKPFTDFTEAR